ncbi:phosphatidate cytidylyltransferase [Mycoplasmopsis cynos]|uniref:hypothetical protein n=1 Tax=Mycoplasmopsis cynos TaxID=171284 RepID=UPI0024C9C7F3|nr:hypothetical protein [Mycoplasmopsis cynos]WAM07060.1 phosphatidate cytidylyltransferase [Mycoplasmopsis cynos]
MFLGHKYFKNKLAPIISPKKTFEGFNHRNSFSIFNYINIYSHLFWCSKPTRN